MPKRTSVVEAEATVHKTEIASARQPPPYPRMNTLPARWRPLLAALVAFIFVGIVAFTANKVLEARAAALRAAAANEQLSAKALARVLSMTFDALAAHVDTTAALVESSTQLLSGGGTNESFERARAPLMYPAFKSFLLVDGKGRVLLDGRKGIDSDVGREDVNAALRHHAEHPGDTKPRLGFPRKANSEPNGVLPISRGIYSANGRLQAVLLVNARMRTLFDVYEQINVARGPLSFSLLGPGDQRFTWAPDGELSGAAASEPDFAKTGIANSSGYFEYDSAERGERTSYGYAAVGTTPLVALIGYAESHVLRGWHRTIVMEAAIALLCAAVVVLLALLISRSVGSLQVFNNRIAIQNRVLHATMRDVKDNLRATTDELDALARVVPQNLSDPTQKARGYLAMAISHAQDSASAPLKSLLRRADAHVRSMEHAIYRVLNLTQVSREMLSRELCDATTMAHQSADRLRKASPGRNVALNIQAGMMAEADRRQLQLVMDNLIGNAWKFTVDAPDAEISVGMQKVNGVRHYFVRDNGIGIDPTKALCLFRPFEGAHERSELNGAGMGLATVQRIARRHCGKVWAEPNKERGVTFWFTLQSGSDAGTGAASSYARATKLGILRA